jgi:predicted RNA-binding Zn ribbon-like protein
MGDVRRMELAGGHPALDFVNTLGGLPERPDDEFLTCYEDLITWLTRVGLLDQDFTAGLAAAAQAEPVEAARVLTGCTALRASLDRVLRAGLDDQAPAPQDLARIQRDYGRAATRATLRLEDGAYRLVWTFGPDVDPFSPLWVLADAALDLLVTAPLQLLGRCRHCRWLYLDASRNRSRRWCSNGCGSIVKMRRYRARLAGTDPVAHSAP